MPVRQIMTPVQTIRKAIVSVAGAGTRFIPATKTMPKEMLPIMDKAIIQPVVEELVEAGMAGACGEFSRGAC